MVRKIAEKHASEYDNLLLLDLRCPNFSKS